MADQISPPAYGASINEQESEPLVKPSKEYLKPDNHIKLAIFATVCCFWPTGIFALLRSNEVDGAYWCGDYKKALETSDKAKWWSKLSVGIGVGLLVIMTALVAVYLAFIIKIITSDPDHN